ncbi:MAG: flagellar biosynthesis protein FlhF [Defluviitaleaceae bacterium]|nr:flagellar biosynthesis protein FlhF [Defluviitaleaceae bacterium]
MKIKKFTAPTEQEAIEKVKAELGPDALIINIKRIQPGGLFAFFRKPSVEVMAAYDDKSASGAAATVMTVEETTTKENVIAQSQHLEPDLVQKFESSKKDVQIAQQEEKIQMLQDMLLATSDMLSKAQSNLTVSKHVESAESRIYQNNLLQIFYNTLIENQVNEDFARETLDELDKKELVEKLDINFVVKIVYNKIVETIGAPSALKPTRSKGNPQIFAFVGPTGVGKTTTIAKLTADLSLHKNLDVGLITADTYRIAAIEQLKTYGDILGIDVAVAYKPEELVEHIRAKKDHCDIILIDTAGRSHKDDNNLRELKEFINSHELIEKFLVLSLTTKFDDMMDIVDKYSRICDFRIIFTKLDETNKIGNIANLSHKTGKKLSYITFGQNVPDDIKTIAPNEVAMRLLGLGDEDGPGK